MKISADTVEKAKNGDKEAFAQIYDSIATDLYKLALFNLGNTYDAEDVVSETFVEAYKSIKTLRDLNSFKPWIMRILYIRCKRKVSEYIKGRSNSDIEEFTDLCDEKIDMEKDVSEKSTIMSALDMVSFEEKEIVLLYVIHGYTTKEISKILNMPHGTVSSKLHRTYAKLRKILTEMEDFNE